MSALPKKATRPPERIRPTEADGRRALIGHAEDKAREARQAYAATPLPGMSLEAFHALLEDRRYVRHPVRITCDAAPLQSDEFACIQANRSDTPGAGFTLFLHPRFEGNEDLVPLIASYYLVCVNYGEIAGPEAAEAFGAALMGMDREEYYRKLCRVADSLLTTSQ